MKRKQKEKKAKDKKEKPVNMQHFLIHRLRRISFMWPERGKALKKARLERGRYTCNKCEGIFSNKEIVVDHIQPVIDPHEGFQTWDIFMDRLFCNEEGMQVICKECHKVKSSLENEIRKEVRKAKKRTDIDGSDI